MPFHTEPSDFEIEDVGLICCVCKTTWCVVGGLHTLADVDCPNCGAGYADVGRNAEY